MAGITDVLNGDKPIQLQVSVDYKSAFILGTVIFVAIVAAYYTIKSLRPTQTG